LFVVFQFGGDFFCFVVFTCACVRWAHALIFLKKIKENEGLLNACKSAGYLSKRRAMRHHLSRIILSVLLLFKTMWNKIEKKWKRWKAPANNLFIRNLEMMCCLLAIVKDSDTRNHHARKKK
jgi:hypothetical protein